MVNHFGKRRCAGRNVVVDGDFVEALHRFIELRHDRAVPLANGGDAAEMTELVEHFDQTRKIDGIEKHGEIHGSDL